MRIGKASAAMAPLIKRVWEDTMLTIKTKTQVYQACMLSTLLYGSESWTLYTRQERRLNTSHLRCLRRILGISGQDHIPNTEVLARPGTLSMYALLTKRRLLAADRSGWQHTTKSAIKTAGQKREEQWEACMSNTHYVKRPEYTICRPEKCISLEEIVVQLSSRIERSVRFVDRFYVPSPFAYCML